MWPLFFGLLIILAVICIASFELLIYILFTRHPLDWERTGKPIGLGQSNARVGFYGWTIARYKLQKQFLFCAPEWAKQDATAFFLLTVYKSTIVLYLVGVVGFLIFGLLLS